MTDYNRGLLDGGGWSGLNELLRSEIIERSAKALFESESRPMLAAAGYPTDWDGQPNTLKLDYRRKARTVIKSVFDALELMNPIKQDEVRGR